MAIYLADKSALTRSDTRPRDGKSSSPSLGRADRHCGIVNLELLYGTAPSPAIYHELAEDHSRRCHEVPVTDSAVDRALEVQSLLADQSQHRSVPLPGFADCPPVPKLRAHHAPLRRRLRAHRRADRPTHAMGSSPRQRRVGAPSWRTVHAVDEFSIIRSWPAGRCSSSAPECVARTPAPESLTAGLTQPPARDLPVPQRSRTASSPSPCRRRPQPPPRPRPGSGVKAHVALMAPASRLSVMTMPGEPYPSASRRTPPG